MRTLPLLLALAGTLLLGLGGCDAVRTSGTASLFAREEPPAGLVEGKTRQAEVRTLLGAPAEEEAGRFEADGRFVLARPQPGGGPVRWRYAAAQDWTRAGVLESRRHVSRELDLVFDAEGVLRRVRLDRRDDGWVRQSIIGSGWH